MFFHVLTEAIFAAFTDKMTKNISNKLIYAHVDGFFDESRAGSNLFWVATKTNIECKTLTGEFERAEALAEH